MLGKKAHLQVTRSKAPKTQQICHYRHATKASGLFYCTTPASALAPAIILLIQVPLQKDSVPIQPVIPWIVKLCLWSRNTLLIIKCHNSYKRSLNSCLCSHPDMFHVHNIYNLIRKLTYKMT